MTSPSEQPESFKLDAYLDGQLSESERDALAREIVASREMQSEVELQKRIDEVLRKSFAPSAAPDELILKLQQTSADRKSAPAARRQKMRLIAVATAATVIWGLLGWRYFHNRLPAPEYDPILPLETIYETRVKEGFKPTWVCSDEHEFASTFQARQGQALLLSAMPAGTKMEGLTYCGGISQYTTTMLARVDGAPVMVFVDRANADIHPAPPSGQSKLHLFRKELGPLVLYEVTPLDHAIVSDYLHLADLPPAG